MKNFISASDVFCSNGDSNIVLDSVSFYINQNSKIGITGVNGSGKSTLLDCIYNSEFSSGSFIKSKDCIYSYVQQEISLDKMAYSVRYFLSEQIEDISIWRIEKALVEVGLSSIKLDSSLESLSGGQRTQVAFAKALLCSPNLLLLDEPTNHLDIKSIIWIEEFLINWKHALLLISHDEKLLDTVTTSTWILRDKSLCLFNMPCTKAYNELYLQDSADHDTFKDENKNIERLEKSAQRLKIWGRDFHSKGLSKKAKSIQKQIEKKKEQLVIPANSVNKWRLSLDGEMLKANVLLRANHVKITTPDKHFLFNIDELNFSPVEKIGIIGGNGVGKSTFISYLWETHLKKCSDSNIRFHDQALISYYDQNLSLIPSHNNLIDSMYTFLEMSNIRSTYDEITASLLKAGFHFDEFNKEYGVLSGGEKSRLIFSCISLMNPNFLLLDEPSNHLDIFGKKQLKKALNNFLGGFLIISHDRALLEQTCNKILLISDNKIREFLEFKRAYNELLSCGNLEDELINNKDEPRDLENEDSLLELLIKYENLLNEDLKRKKKHQKVSKHSLWKQRISDIKAKLEI